MHNSINHADGAAGARAIDGIDLPRTRGGRARESRAPSAGGCVDPLGQAPTAPHEGPTLLDPPRQGVAGLAPRLDDRAAPHRGAVAPPMAPAAVEVAARTYTSGAAHPGCGAPHARPHAGP